MNLPQTNLQGAVTLQGFRFEREELAYFEKQVWGRRPASVRKLAERVRTALADLSMNPELQLDYEVDNNNARTETFRVHCHEDRNVMVVHLTDARFHGHQHYVRLDDTPSQVLLYINSNAGTTYGERGQIEIATIVYKLRQMLLDLRMVTGYLGTAVLRQLDPEGMAPSMVTQLTFRPWDENLSDELNTQPDNGEVQDQFHIVVELKNPGFLPKPQ